MDILPDLETSKWLEASGREARIRVRNEKGVSAPRVDTAD